jgi:hypothetical protein
VIIFDSVRFLSKKNNQTKIFFLKKKLKPNRNRVKPTGFGSVRFGFLGQKPVQTGLARFSGFGSVYQFWLGFLDFGSVFFGLARCFLVWLGFGSVFPVSVRFSSVFSVFCL